MAQMKNSAGYTKVGVAEKLSRQRNVKEIAQLLLMSPVLLSLQSV